MVTQPKWQYTANVYDIDGHHLDRPAEWIGDLSDDHIGDRKQLVDRMICFFGLGLMMADGISTKPPNLGVALHHLQQLRGCDFLPCRP